MMFRKMSAKPLAVASSSTGVNAAPPPAPVIPDLPVVNAEPLALDSLTPRELSLKAVTATEVTVQYSLPPTSTTIGGSVDVRVMIRPSRLFKTCAAEEQDIQKQIFNIRQEFQRKNMAMMNKQSHETFMEQQRVIQPLQFKMNDVWSQNYVIKCKELLPFHPEANANQVPFGGWYSVDIESSLCWPSERLTELGIVSIVKSPENNTIKIKSLASNVFYEIVMCARRTGATCPEESTDRVWSPLSAPLGFSTKTAPWQLALEKAGLRHLIEPFTVQGFDSFESWMTLTQANKEDMGIDSAADALLSDILSLNGIVTPTEQARIDRERVEMTGVVSTLLTELKGNQASTSVGDAVVEKIASNKKRGPRFGVVVAVNDKGTECSVRWEDARTKDPANSIVESGVKITAIQKTQFTLFLSHAQADAQNQVAHLSVLLRDQEAKIWFDQDSERLEARDMVRGIANSKVFLLYLTKSYFDRWFCKMEASVAKALQKPLIIVYEPDERFGGTGDYVSLVNACTKKYPEFKDFLMQSEAIPMARRAFQRRAVVDEICKRAGVSSKSSSDIGSGDAKSSPSGEITEINDLKQMLLDLKMEMNDLKAENRDLRTMVESFVAGSTGAPLEGGA